MNAVNKSLASAARMTLLASEDFSLKAKIYPNYEDVENSIFDSFCVGK